MRHLLREPKHRRVLVDLLLGRISHFEAARQLGLGPQRISQLVSGFPHQAVWSSLREVVAERAGSLEA